MVASCSKILVEVCQGERVVVLDCINQILCIEEESHESIVTREVRRPPAILFNPSQLNSSITSTSFRTN